MLSAYLTRLHQNKRIKRFDIVSEWVGHGLHGPAMILMGLVMLGIVGGFGPWQIWSGFFSFTGAVFVFRLATKRYIVWWWDGVHVILNAAMAYMFVPEYVEVITLAFLVFYVAWFIPHYIKETIDDLTPEAPGPKDLNVLSDLGHLAMGIAMVIMFAVMQKPSWFQDPSANTTPTGHQHHTQTITFQGPADGLVFICEVPPESTQLALEPVLK